jgi:hypothetical protein
MTDRQPRKIPVADLLDWASESSPAFRVRTAVDALPGGYSAAMAPLLVNWKHSSHNVDTAVRPSYLVRNVNINGNPVEGITHLCTVRIPVDGVEAAEFVTVPLGAGGIQIGGHGMIRLVFGAGNAPVVLSQSGLPFPGRSKIRDLVFSWEAWRPPGVQFTMKKGLDPNTFGLTLRCYTGAQRFLEDAMQRRDWTCYPLSLPSGEKGLRELLYVALVTGDSLARHTILKLFEDAQRAGYGETPSDYPDPEITDLQTLKNALVDNQAPEDPITDIMGGKINYQLCERSCITMALELVAMTARRLTSHLPPGEQIRVRVTPENVPGWIDDLAHAGRAGIFLRVPHMLWWLMHNANVLPTRAYRILEEAGLLHRDNGGVIRRQYRLFEETPYGKLRDNLLV